MNRYVFFYEEFESEPFCFVDANDHIEAREQAYENFGPQIDDMLCKKVVEDTTP